MADKLKVYMGLDLNEERAMASLYCDGMKEPESLSASASEERFLVPMAIYCTNKGRYFYGDEAIRRKERPEGTFLGNLYEEALDPQNQFARQMLVQFIRRLIRFCDRYHFQNWELVLSVTIPEITDSAVRLFDFVREELELLPENFCLMDYGESFFAHTYSQDPSIWLHDVALFDLTNDKIRFILLHLNDRRRMRWISSERREWDLPEELQEPSEKKDAFLAQIVRKCFQSKIISGVYCIGAGFDGGWMKDTLRMMGSHKRVFKGKNLHTIGACLAACLKDMADGLTFYYDCPYKVKGELSLKLMQNGEMTYHKLTQLGENWFSPVRDCYLLCDGDDTLEVRIRTLNNWNGKTETFTLADLPPREPKSVRLRVQAIMANSTEGVLRILDDGFGDLFESSGKIWEFPIRF